MNKFMVYTVFAILLGTVTMVVPLALLGPDNPILSNDDVISQVESEGSETPERGDMLTLPEEPSFTVEVPGEEAPNDELDDYTQSDLESSDKSPEVPPEPTVTTWGEGEVISNLSSIGLIVIPGFVVALGVFVILKRRTF